MWGILDPARPTFLLAAHPDDEVIGAGCTLARLPGLMVAHATDGAPLNMADARAHGFNTRDEYARKRRLELSQALRLAGVPDVPLVEFSIPDQQVSFNLVDFTQRLIAALPDRAILLTHPYEGGHPDHDGCAFASQAACKVRTDVVRAEFTSYHADRGQADAARLQCGRFLSESACEVTALTDGDRRRKQQMLDCFITQRETLSCFTIQDERFRLAPEYDFTRPPHPGQLFYERFDWGMTGERFRALAREALQKLHVGVASCG
jgi:N-acetylglucosamine malate deacetylase 2